MPILCLFMLMHNVQAIPRSPTRKCVVLFGWVSVVARPIHGHEPAWVDGVWLVALYWELQSLSLA